MDAVFANRQQPFETPTAHTYIASLSILPPNFALNF
jgi:hypothetical protein